MTRNTVLCRLYAWGLLLGALCFSLDLSYAQEEYGLYLLGNNSPKNIRSGLHLNPEGNPFVFAEHFEISFKLKADQPNRKFFGYVLRLVGNNVHHIDLVECTRSQDCAEYNLVLGTKAGLTTVPLIGVERSNSWREFKLRIDRISEILEVWVDGDLVATTPYSQVAIEGYRVAFGACDISRYKTRDVPPFYLREVNVALDSKAYASWRLAETQGNTVDDELSGLTARISHPRWVYPMHQNWRPIRMPANGATQQICVDPATGRLFVITRDSLYTHQVKNRNWQKRSLKGLPLAPLRPGDQATFVTKLRQIVISHLDERAVLRLQPWNGLWKTSPALKARPNAYLHHTATYFPPDSSLYFWGGYGRHHYQGEAMRLDVATGEFTALELQGDRRTPRYLAAAGVLNDSIYLLGGYGADDGNQLHAPRHYHDLYVFHPSSGVLKKRYSFSPSVDSWVYASSLVIAPATRTYYALAFSNFSIDGKAQLVRGHLDRPGQERLAEPLPFQFVDTESTAHLFYLPQEGQLIVALNEEANQKQAYTLHAIAFPPNAQDFSLDHYSKKSLPSVSTWLMGLLVLLSIGFIAWYQWRRTWLKSSTFSADRKATVVLSNSAKHPTLPLHVEAKNTLHKPAFQIVTMGEFRVWNQAKQDITASFSPLLKELFLLLLFHSVNGHSGISNRTLMEYLWPDKPLKKAKNNRSVNLTKLRQLLANTLPLEIAQDSGRYTITFLEPATTIWDYAALSQLLAEPSFLLADFKSIIGGYRLLPYVDYIWLDDYKSNLSTRLTASLKAMIDQAVKSRDDASIISGSAILLKIDTVNEFALQLYCQAVVRAGNTYKAERAFQLFQEEYAVIYGEPYANSIQQLLTTPYELS